MTGIMFRQHRPKRQSNDLVDWILFQLLSQSTAGVQASPPTLIEQKQFTDILVTDTTNLLLWLWSYHWHHIFL